MQLIQITLGLLVANYLLLITPSFAEPVDETFTEAWTAEEDDDAKIINQCDACVNSKWASWCNHTHRCFNAIGFLAHVKECPLNKKDSRPNWGQGCTGQKVNGVWGNNHSQFFHSDWAKERDEIVRKTLAYDVRTRYGKTFAISKKLGCPDSRAQNFNPYRKQAPECTGLQALKKAQEAIHRTVGLKKSAKIRKKLLKAARAKANALHAKELKAATSNYHRALFRAHSQPVTPSAGGANHTNQANQNKSAKLNAIARAARRAQHNVTKAMKRLDALAAKREAWRAAIQYEKDLKGATTKCVDCANSKKTQTSQCSVSCACSRGGVMTPYGKYSGIKYTACAGEVPCDPVDSAAQMHDWCVSQRGMFSCECARQIFATSKAAGRYLKRNPGHGLCPLAATAAAELVFESGMQWGACKLASKACKFFWLDTLGVKCGTTHDAETAGVFPSLLQRFKALDSDGSGEISLKEAHKLRHVHSPGVALGSLEIFSRWHNGLDKDSSGGLNEKEYMLSWGA